MVRVGQFDVIWTNEEGRLSAEISVEGEVDAVCRAFVQAVENEDPKVEVHWI